jgi:single-strand DNA-binding protein
MSYHTIIIVGNLGKDPEMRYTPSGQPVTTLSVATNRKYSNSAGQAVTEKTWFKVSVWGKQAEASNTFLKKGSLVLVEGRMVPDANGNPRIYTRGDGTPGANFEVTAQTVRFLSSNGAHGDGSEMPEGAEVGEGDIPF